MLGRVRKHLIWFKILIDCFSVLGRFLKDSVFSHLENNIADREELLTEFVSIFSHFSSEMSCCQNIRGRVHQLDVRLVVGYVRPKSES